MIIKWISNQNRRIDICISRQNLAPRRIYGDTPTDSTATVTRPTATVTRPTATVTRPTAGVTRGTGAGTGRGTGTAGTGATSPGPLGLRTRCHAQRLMAWPATSATAIEFPESVSFIFLQRQRCRSSSFFI